MIEKLSATLRKRIAMGILASVVLILFLITLLPIMLTHMSYNDEINNTQNRLQRYRKVASNQQYFQKKLDQLKQNYPGKDYYLKNTGEALAAAELSGIVKKAVKKHSGELISTRAISNKEDKELKGFRKITIKVEMRGDVSTLQNVLYQLEMGRPLLFIDQVRIRARKARRSRSKSKSTSAASGNLDIRVEVSGYIKNATG